MRGRETREGIFFGFMILYGNKQQNYILPLCVQSKFTDTKLNLYDYNVMKIYAILSSLVIGFEQLVQTLIVNQYNDYGRVIESVENISLYL